MDIAPSITTTTTTNNTASTKSPEADSETPIRIQPAKPISFSNGVLKRHAPAHHHHTHSQLPITTTTTNPVVVSYKECLKNHAASLGGHALDGCGEFMPSPTAVPTDPTSLKCAACGCHRNFHRREPEDNIPALPAAATTHVIEYQPHHRHHPPPPIIGNRSPNSASPPPISSSYYPSAPHMLLALSTGISGQENPNNHPMVVSPGPNSRKRFRTKFTQDQKDKMYQFAERVGWKMQKRDEDIVNEFCSDIGVDKGVLKVWMHNNKNTFAKRDVINGSGNGGGNGIPTGLGGGGGVRVDLIGHHHHNMNGDNNNNNNGSNEDDEEEDNDNPHIINNTNGGSNVVGNPNRHHYQVGVGGGDHHHRGATNGGSSSSS